MVKKTFRDGTYYRHVWFGKRTVKEGECAAVWSPSGVRTCHIGPQRVRLFFSHVRFLNRHVADQNEYLAVQFRDGRKEHHRGPQSWFMDPCVHISITTHQAWKLSANEVLVVYREQPGEVPLVAAAEGVGPDAIKLTGRVSAVGVPGSVQRRLVRGPAVFIPDAHEWVHEFSWHGSIEPTTGRGSKTGKPGDEKVPHALNFNKLRCMPDQMYVSVKGVRTTDDAQVTVHLMIFYELKHIEAMLDATNDPIGDCINATSADVMTFGAANTYESLLLNTTQLSDLATFPILAGRMQQTGLELLKCVYRGYSASDTLQSMHDQAIAKRTKLKLEADTRAMEQEQAAADLQCKQQRSQAEMALQAAERKHQNELLDLAAGQERAARDADHAQALRHEGEAARAAVEAQRAANDEVLRVNEALAKLGVELTQYLCVKEQRQPDTHIKLDGAGGGGASGGTTTNLHLDVPARGAGAARRW